MDLQQLADRTGIPIRRLRHCLDQGLVPGLEINIADNLAGRPRKFAEDVGFAICCAAKLIETGIDRSTVRTFMKGLATVTFPGSRELLILAFFARRAAGIAQLGDNLNMRVEITAHGEVVDTGWIHPGNPAPLSQEYRPMMAISLDIGQIGCQVFGWKIP